MIFSKLITMTLIFFKRKTQVFFCTRRIGRKLRILCCQIRNTNDPNRHDLNGLTFQRFGFPQWTENWSCGPLPRFYHLDDSANDLRARLARASIICPTSRISSREAKWEDKHNFHINTTDRYIVVIDNEKGLVQNCNNFHHIILLRNLFAIV